VITRYCAIVWAIQWVDGAPTQKGCLHIVVLMCAQTPRNENGSLVMAKRPRGLGLLAFTRYCHDQYYMVYGLQKGSRRGVVYCAIVVR